MSLVRVLDSNGYKNYLGYGEGKNDMLFGLVIIIELKKI